MIIKPYEKQHYVTLLLEHPCNGHAYELHIAKPLDPPSTKGYGVIYVLDGNAMFETAAEITRLMTRKPKGYDPAVVVGIGYPGGEPFDMQRRSYDLTMKADPAKLPVRPNSEPWPATGGADELLELLEHTIMPQLQTLFAINPDKQALFGHSLGGLFTLHALFTRSQLFTHYVASSASIWWNDYALLQEYEHYRLNMSSDTMPKVMLIVGAEELDHMVKDSRQLYERMKQDAESGAVVQYVELEQEEHVSVIPAAISRAVKGMLAME